MILIAESFNHPKYGTLLDIWYVGGEHRIVKRPFNPYFYSLVKLPNSFPVEKILLENVERGKQTIWLKEFTDTRQLEKERDPAYTFQDDIPYIQLVAAKMGFKYPSPKPKHKAFDTEWNGDKLIALGYGDKDDIEVFTGEEKEILARFNEILAVDNPDILDTYWGSYFDVEKLQKKAEELGVKLRWGRDGSEPFIKRREYRHGAKRGMKQQVRIKGRIHFDVFNEVEMDQTLSGIKNKRLQTVAEWFKFGEASKIDHGKLMQYGIEVVKSECAEDVRKTWMLADHYLQNLYTLADHYLYLPLNLLVERSPSHIPNYIYMREFEEKNIVASRNNAERFPAFFVWERKSYEGALVKLYNPGIYEKVSKIDFRSMYPSICACFNFDPLTVKLLDINRGLEWEGWVAKFEGRKITIFDKNIKGTFTIRIENKEGITKKWIAQLMEWREQIKSDKSLTEDEKRSRQWAIKIMMNSLYGYHGMKHARYGWAPIAAATTGIGRWMLLEAIKFIDKDVKVIEADTDGIYYEGTKGLADKVQSYIRSIIPSIYDPSFIKITEERYDGGIFYEEKGYVLKKNERYEFHGSGLTGRHHARICDKALEAVVDGIFKGEEIKDVLWQFANLKKFPFEDFILTIELRKVPSQYKEGTMIHYLLKELGDVEIGDEIQYVKTRKGFKPVEKANKSDLDYDYYRERIAEVLARILKPTKRINTFTIEQIIKGGQQILG